MKEITGDPSRIKYRWPRVLLAVVVLGIVMYVVWLTLAVLHVEEERDLNAPLPTQTPVH